MHATEKKSAGLPSPLVAIQMNSASIADEGADTVLDTVQRLAGVNTLYLVSMSWARGTGGRQQPGQPLPDHGVQEYDLDWQGGLDVPLDGEYQRNPLLGPPNASVEYGENWNLFEEVAGKAKSRGMGLVGWIAESVRSPRLFDTPGFWRFLEFDAWGRPARAPCYRNPLYLEWYSQVVEDWAHNAPIDAICFAPERAGPLNILIESPTDLNDIGVHGPFGGAISCFCPHCCAAAERRKIDPVRAQQGYRELIAWNADAAKGNIPADGCFVTFWRLLLEYPEILAWQRLWSDGQEQFMKQIYGVAKSIRPAMQVGWHLYHNYSFSPFCRASSDYKRWGEFSDFLKVVVYNATGGPRMNSWVGRTTKALFADTTPERIFPVFMDFMGLTEGPLEALRGQSLSPAYVAHEIGRAVQLVSPSTAIHAGIDVDIPNNFGVQVENRSTRAQVKDAVTAAFKAGAKGVVLSRKYSEMTLENLAGAGDALAGLGMKTVGK